MRVEVFSNNLVNVNTYFVINDDKCLLIDPGSNAKQIFKLIETYNVDVLGIVLTHAHFDHFLSLNEINKVLNVPIYLHSKGVEMLYDAEKNVSAGLSYVRPLVLNQDFLITTINEETKDIAGFKLHILHVPGHSPDGIAIYSKEENFIFTGDALFKLSIGRSDFYKGDEKQLIQNIKKKLLNLPEDTIIYPGHGPASTIGYEKKYNHYIK